MALFLGAETGSAHLPTLPRAFVECEAGRAAAEDPLAQNRAGIDGNTTMVMSDKV